MPLPEPIRTLIARARRKLLVMDLTQRLVTVTAVLAIASAAVIGVAR